MTNFQKVRKKIRKRWCALVSVRMCMYAFERRREGEKERGSKSERESQGAF
jgi:hypothetical protein